ncbi:LacI family DNA-binding transcriptional regulator [Paenibacillus glufosinatiresistens]|uniref:LacI family DNA-binding transcriptional regulator n=1 Tax=Paenibacillus glufosinatiresistens TaxID=3070657 RepID=UPI00286E2875|nr:LacI family DNA-binding transcriptional regulator [Paenibacillus sp. YX.27]
MQNGHRRVTMRDIAAEAGVSSATVSYVLNYSEKEKISHETRLRVFEAARKLNYVPDMTAKTLANRQSRMIGLIAGGNRSRGRRLEQYDLVDALQKEMGRRGYDTLLLSAGDPAEQIRISRSRSLDGAFLIDVDTETLKQRVQQFVIPLVFIDSHLGDPLFHEVLGDYETIFCTAAQEKEPFFVVMEDGPESYVYRQAERVCGREHLYVEDGTRSMEAFLGERRGMRGIVLGEALGVRAERQLGSADLTVVVGSAEGGLLAPGTRRILIDSVVKAEMAADLLAEISQMHTDRPFPPAITRVSPVPLD